MTVFSARSLAALEAGTGDVTVVACDGTEFKAHSFVLSHSPVIEATLSGEMQEPGSRRLTIDCNSETAQAFFKFLYTGGLLASSITTLGVVVDLFRVADIYAVENELSAACSEKDGRAIVSEVLDSVTWQTTDDAVVRSLQQLCQIRNQYAEEMLKQCIERVDPQLGINMFEWLCTFEAIGALEVCMQVLQTRDRILPSRDAAWLDNEINNDKIAQLLGVHSRRPNLLLVAVSAYFKIVARATPSGIRPTQPEVGQLVQTDCGRCGVLVEVREDQRYCNDWVAWEDFCTVFEAKPNTSPPYHIQFGHECTWFYRCFGAHEHTLLLKRFPQVVKTVLSFKRGSL
eukprot:TRINITY_DN14202_c0_g8_i1.p1 TRINITY_DN14202_c0_g8~~TRINITY_DN14202_c0_g8_i1.p1  ORF type:complete len:343 (-),score=37.30 TRINITY_DN14202_c0_g8_i1:240-1268(-)